MLVGTPPYFSQDREKLFENIERGPLKLPSVLSPNSKDLLKDLLQRNPTKRLGSTDNDALDVKAHKFFSGVNWNEVLNKKIIPPQLPQRKQNLNLTPMPLHDDRMGQDDPNHLTGWSFIQPPDNTNNK